MGSTARDIYLRTMNGINGTPMPESGDALTPDQVWQGRHYVRPWRLAGSTVS